MDVSLQYQLVDPLPFQPPSNVELNFEHYSVVDVDGVEGNDQSLLIHPNGLCVIRLASGHAALRPGHCQQEPQCNVFNRETNAAEIKIEFDVGRRSLLAAEYRKGRGPLLSTDTALCRVISSGKAFILRCLVRGALVDVNERLAGVQGEDLIRELRGSYIAIVNLREAEVQRLRRECLSAEQYTILRSTAASI